MRELPCYFSAYAIRDGTVWLANEKRKPSAASGMKIDPEGIFYRYVDHLSDRSGYTDTAKVIRGATIATCLNTKRIVRERVEAPLVGIEAQLRSLQDELARVHQKLDRIIGQLV